MSEIKPGRHADAFPSSAPDLPGDWRVWRTVLWLSAALSTASLYHLIQWADGTGPYLGHFARGWLIRMLPVLLMGLAAAWVAATGRLPLGRLVNGPVNFLVNGLWRFLRRLGMLNLVLFMALPGAMLAILWSPQVELIERSLPRGWIAGHLALAGGVFWLAAWGKSARRPLHFLASAALSLVSIGVVFKILAFVPEVNNYPFRLGWSEASRFYYASLFFSKSLYGVQLPLPVLHPSRYLLQSIPYLVAGLPLWVHRLWQVLLWVGVTGLGGWALARRLRLGRPLLTGLAAAWGALFFFQGAVYYHLMVCVVLVLLGFDRDRPWRSTVFILAASLWAGISRVNWIPLPGVLAVTLYVLETPSHGRGFWRYWLPPLGWVAGGSLAALAAQSGYALISGNDLGQFGSSLTSDLLWYRLYANPTFPTGILRAVANVSVPLLLVFFYRLVRSGGAYRALRWLALFAILLVFFAGGLVVSVKIGGGADLHNMDAFLVFLAVIGAYLSFDRFTPDQPARFRPTRGIEYLAALAVFVPVLMTLNLPQPGKGPPMDTAAEELATLQGYLDQVSTDPREVLFISDRHLITFGLVQHVGMVDDYEKVFLMEMAMANNATYLQRFTEDLSTHRFSLIISEGMQGVIKDQTYGFSEENNAWLERVADPVLDSYSEISSLDDSNLVIYAPKPEG